MESEFPPNNNHRQRPTRPEAEPRSEKTVQRVTTSKAIRRKKPMMTRVKETFFTGSDNQSVMEYMFEGVMDGARDIFVDVVTGGLERKFYGDDYRNAPRRRGGRDRGRTVYNRMSEGRRRDPRDREDPRDRDRGRRSSRAPDVTQIIMPTRVEAEEALDALIELVSKYDNASVKDLLSLVGEPHKFTDGDWGWTDLRGSRVHRVGGGYLIDVPRPEPLDD